MIDIRIGICDDEKEHRANIKIIIEKFFQQSVYSVNIYEFDNAFEVLNFDKQLMVLILDVEMQNMNGIELKNIFQKYYKKCKIIFVSNYEDKVMEAFGENVLAYIPKNKLSDILIYLEKLEKSLYEHEIIVFAGNRIEVIDIIYIKANGSYSNIHTITNDYMCCIYLTDIMKKLKIYSFIKVHRSYIVNLRYIKNIEQNTLILNDGTRIPISQTFIEEVLHAYYNYVRSIL